MQIEGGCLREGEYRGLDCVGGKTCRELGPGCTLGTLAKDGLLRNAPGTTSPPAMARLMGKILADYMVRPRDSDYGFLGSL